MGESSKSKGGLRLTIPGDGDGRSGSASSSPAHSPQISPPSSPALRRQRSAGADDEDVRDDILSSAPATPRKKELHAVGGGEGGEAVELDEEEDEEQIRQLVLKCMLTVRVEWKDDNEVTVTRENGEKKTLRHGQVAASGRGPYDRRIHQHYSSSQYSAIYTRMESAASWYSLPPYKSDNVSCPPPMANRKSSPLSLPPSPPPSLSSLTTGLAPSPPIPRKPPGLPPTSVADGDGDGKGDNDPGDLYPASYFLTGALRRSDGLASVFGAAFSSASAVFSSSCERPPEGGGGGPPSSSASPWRETRNTSMASPPSLRMCSWYFRSPSPPPSGSGISTFVPVGRLDCDERLVLEEGQLAYVLVGDVAGGAGAAER